MDKIAQMKEKIAEADAVVIGAGAGLSTAAGFTYKGERFRRYFADFEERYHFHDMYSGGFYPYDTLEEYWAYWSRYIWINRYSNPPAPTYDKLLELVKDKDYFVLTTNVDHCFQKAGFDKKRIFYTQGDYGLFQCSEPCCQEAYDNEKSIRQMLLAQGYQIDTTGELTIAGRYYLFRQRHEKLSIVYLELGVGYNTPGIIKYPFWQMTAANPKATYICLNYGQAAAPAEIQRQSICIDGNIGEIL